jgi:predicted transcriptional regulator
VTPAEQRVERKRIAEKMANQGFTQELIAKQLGVSQRQISTDLEGLEVTSKPDRPKGGRPKGAGAKRPKKDESVAARDDKARALRADNLERVLAGEPIEASRLRTAPGAADRGHDDSRGRAGADRFGQRRVGSPYSAAHAGRAPRSPGRVRRTGGLRSQRGAALKSISAPCPD